MEKLNRLHEMVLKEAKSITWENKETDFKMVDTDIPTIFGGTKRRSVDTGSHWDRVTKPYDEELLQILKDAEKRGQVRNIKILEK